MLTCSCDYDDGKWYYYPPHDFSLFAKKRQKRCCSCGRLIKHGAQCVAFDRYRPPVSDIEEKISGDEVSLADWYMCERCGEIYFNLEVLGYCIILGESMQNYLESYWEMTGFTPKKQIAESKLELK